MLTYPNATITITMYIYTQAYSHPLYMCCQIRRTRHICDTTHTHKSTYPTPLYSAVLNLYLHIKSPTHQPFFGKKIRFSPSPLAVTSSAEGAATTTLSAQTELTWCLSLCTPAVALLPSAWAGVDCAARVPRLRNTRCVAQILLW